MRDKNLLHLFLVLNVAIGGCFLAYLFISRNNQPQVVATRFDVPAPKTDGVTSVPPTKAVPSSTNEIIAAPPAAVEVKPILTNKKFDWEQIESAEYQAYINSLRAVGCPEDKVRYIIMADINQLFANKRREEAIAKDTQWWKAQQDIMIANVLQQKGRELEEARRTMIEKLLGSDALEFEKSESMLWSSIQLTGPVLGALPTDLHNTVQEICARSIDRHNGAFWARVNEGQGLNTVEMAKLREQTRADLRRVLNAEQMEEFLLRYSHNSQQLRFELQGFDPTPEEFRKIFRAVDPLQHQLQLEYGGTEALSPQQRERLDRQRDAAIRETLGPQRYEQFLVTKDPLYRQAQAVAQQYGAPPKTIMPIYQMTKATEVKRQKIYADAGLTPQQKSEALNVVNQEQMRSVQKIVSEASVPR
ncbi:MAG: hypothetical protein QOF48_3456 [Verrucomicrobiota bacterium]|jgi:hypothetical protein